MKLKLVIFLALIFGFVLIFNENIFARDGGPAKDDPDINITLRNWKPASFPNQLIDHPQNTDLSGAPQLSYTFGAPNFTNFYQINARGGPSAGLDSSNTNSPGAATISFTSGDDIRAPVVDRSIGSGFNYTILYATSTDIVIHNGLEDSVAKGYTIHFLNINVNPTLLQMYNDNEAKGRTQLVAIPCGFVIGSASGDPFVSIRDTGSFMDPRFKDWWGNGSTTTCQDVPAGYVTAGSGNQPSTDTQTYDVSQNIPCDQTNTSVYTKVDPNSPNYALEYHSDRPYPASPCLKQVQDTTLMCSNDLVAIKSTTPGPNGACTLPDANGAYSCTYTNVPEHVPVAIDLTNAQLPILGNTEQVPNATWTSPNTNASNLSAAQRVNSFVSWYLGGVVNKAENDFSGDDPNNLINYSGPLNKLLPWAGQAIARIATSNKAATSQGQGPNAPDKNGRHNQIVECDIPGQSGSMPCYLYLAGRFASFLKTINPDIPANENGGTEIGNLSTIRRLIDWIGHFPLLETNFNNVGDWIQAYSNWLGNICITPILGCPTSAPNALARFFNFIPQSTTEDRVGLIGTSQILSNNNSGDNALQGLSGSNLNSQYLQGLISAAASSFNVPVNVLVALVHGEACQGGGPLCTASDQDVQSWSNEGGFLPYNCVGSVSGGPLGMNVLTWSNAKNAVNFATGENRTPNVCNVKDALYAAAAVIAGSAGACYDGGVAKATNSWDQTTITNALTAWACGCDGSTPSCQNAKSLYLSSTTDPYVFGNSGVTTVTEPTSNSGAVTFTPDGVTNYQHNLYFAHAQEAVELATQLQQTYKSGQSDAASNHDTNTAPDIAPGCNIVDSRGDPTGDNLYGNVDRTKAQGYAQDDRKISGTVNFLATYTCHFTPISQSGNSLIGGNTGVAGNYTYKCDPAIGSLSIFTKSPEVQNAWDILVGGSQSIFKRFFPQTGGNSPVSEIKEVPANTNITYQATGGDAVAAGGTNGGGTTAQAQAYVPYVGGIKDYFLDAIQTALRPKGMGSSTSLSSGGITFPGGKIPTGLCSPSNLSSFGSNASAMSCVCSHESGGNPFAKNLACLHGGTEDYSIGLFQINLLAHPNPVPPSLRDIFMHPDQHGYQKYVGQIPDPSTVSCYKAFSGLSPCGIKSGYEAVVQICVDWFSDPNNNIEYARQLFSSNGISPWTGDRKACGL